MNCPDVDALGAAFALDAVDPDERQAIVAHLEACARPHAELRSLLGAGTVLASALEPVTPSAQLRDRVMASAVASPQERAGARPAVPRPEPTAVRAPRSQPTARRGFVSWLSPPVARGVAVGGFAAATVLAVLSISLSSQLGERDAALRAIAATVGDGGPAYRVDSDVGSGYVVERDGPGAAVVLADVADPGEDLLYALWLIPGDGAPVPVGTFVPSGQPVTVVPLDRDLAGFAAFAVTIEEMPVDAPTSDPVLVAPLES